MKNAAITMLVVACLVAATETQAQTVRHVWTNSPFPGAPFNAWTNAARTIQDAVDAAAADDVILITNGIYDAGGKWSGWNTLTNRVYVSKALSLTSVNGASSTFIVGQADPVSLSNGNAAIRGLYLVEGCSLQGFTVTGGHTRLVTGAQGSGGGVYCASTNVVITNCAIIANMAHDQGGGVFQGALYDCGVFSNHLTRGADSLGGGAYSSVAHRCRFEGNYLNVNGGGGGAGACVLHDCDFTRNIGRFGAAARLGVLYNCRVFGHTSGDTLRQVTAYNSSIWGNTSTYSAGASYSTLFDCDITGNLCGQGTLTYCTAWRCNIISNSADYSGLQRTGGGALLSKLYNCTVSYNVVAVGDVAQDARGGGAYQSALYNCLVAHNTAEGGHGGGLYASEAQNCTVVSNLATRIMPGSNWRGGDGGGAWYSTNYNSIIYYNNAYAGSNWHGAASEFYNTCTAPQQAAWAAGNISVYPLFAAPSENNWRLTRTSPCFNTGQYFSWMDDPSDARSSDLDGGPRIRHNTVDMGAYELRVPRGSVFSAE